MLNVLINAYAVSPSWGSEQGMGWNWVSNLAKYCNVFVITEGEYETEIEATVESLPQKNNLHFYYIPFPEKVRAMCWNQGDWRFYFYYRKWQKQAYELEKKIINDNKDSYPIDLVHHLNMIGFREPGYEWKHSLPYVWGPIGGMEITPTQFLAGETLSLKIAIYLKNFLNDLQRKYQPNVRKALARADVLTAATKGVSDFILKYHKKNAVLINETGCYCSEYQCNLSQKDTFDILWVGKFDFRKQLRLALESFALLNDCSGARLHIVGPGSKSEERRYRELSSSLNLGERVMWYGKIPHNEVQDLMRHSDVFLLTSIMEGTPHVVLEAVQNALPIICFNACGHAGVVNDAIGIKIEQGGRKQAVSDFAEALRRLYHNPDMRMRMSCNCKERQKELSWDNKCQLMVHFYQEAIAHYKASNY